MNRNLTAFLSVICALLLFNQKMVMAISVQDLNQVPDAPGVVIEKEKPLQRDDRDPDNTIYELIPTLPNAQPSPYVASIPDWKLWQAQTALAADATAQFVHLSMDWTTPKPKTSLPVASEKSKTKYREVQRRPKIYVVKEGDTLPIIANRIFGQKTGWTNLYLANQKFLSDARNFRAGAQLVVPDLSQSDSRRTTSENH